MSNLYLMPSKNEKLSQKILQNILSNQSPKPVLYSPVFSEFYEALASKFGLDFSFSFKNGVQEFSEDKNIFFTKIMRDYDELEAKFELIFVCGIAKFSIFDTLGLNLSIAKNLNTPFVMIEENRALASAYLAQKLGKKDFVILDENSDLTELKTLKKYDFLTTHRFKLNILKKSSADQKVVVLPESNDERVLRAADILLKMNALKLIILGDKAQIQKDSKCLGLDLSKAEFINPAQSELNDEFANTLYELRKNKGLSLEKAAELIKDKNYFGTMLVFSKKADAMVSGASCTTADTIRPALQIIKTKPGVSSVSGLFFMGLEDRVLAFADCAVAPKPSAEELAQSAYVSALSAKSFGLEPRIAMLSYSTGDSGCGECVDLINEALKIAKQRYPELEIDGPLQFDAAFDEVVAAKKMPNSSVAGRANVYIFPNLDCANICYKAVQRTANALAIGPILQGLKAPVNDLSRGCLIDDIVDTVLLSAVQAQG